MMKKLLIMLTVLAMASSANATLSVVGDPDPIDIGAVSTVSVSAAGEVANLSQMIVVEGPVSMDPATATVIDPWGAVGTSIGDFTDNADAQAFAAAFGLSPIGILYFEVIEISIDPAAVDGAIAGVDITGLAEGTATITLLDAATGEMGSSGTVEVIPEPMTIALLGLGGLFLRRRK
jgi:hypothetical protein